MPQRGPGARRTGKENRSEAGPEKTHRRRVVRHQLQPLPSGAVCHRVHVSPMEDDHAAHARAGQSPGRPGEANPQIPPGRRWQLNQSSKNFTHENIFLHFRRGGGSLRAGDGPDSARGGDDQR